MPNFYNKYPYTDFHELNLDWVLETVKQDKETVEQNVQDNQQFKEDLTDQQEDFEQDMRDWKGDVDQDLSDWKTDTIGNLNIWKGNTVNTFQGQITDMNNEWDTFINDYQQQGPVTQNPYGDNILEVTSQAAVNESITRYYGRGNLLFKGIPTYDHLINGATITTTNLYSYFECELTANTTYYMENCRLISNGSTNVATYPTSYTPTVTGTYYVVFYNDRNDWKLSTNSDLDAVCGFNSPSFSKGQLLHDINASKSKVVSQYGTQMIKGGYHGQKNILFGCTVHFDYYHNGTNAVSNNNYSYFEVPMTAGTTYYFGSTVRFVADNGYQYGQNLDDFTPSATQIYYITFRNTRTWILSTDSDIASISAYNEPSFNSTSLAQSIGSATNVPMSQKAVSDAIGNAGGNFLYNKVWYALGDSFTHGDFTGASDYTFTDAPYQGENKVYPFYIGRRCGMIIHNLAVNGMTLADYTGGVNVLSNGTYQNVAADADYITIKIGINDGHNNIPIGSINDAVNTTFYGAWNVVMSWLIANRPLARIGIIVSNGLTDASYATATIAIAKKYGVPYLNEWDGEQVPVLCRSGRTDVDATIITDRTNTYRVSVSNNHPNTYAHERESDFVETWLKTL